MDSCKCVICYDEKASCFCQKCKTSSGICYSCRNEIQNQNYIESPDIPIECVICKSKMWQQSLVQQISEDLDGMSDLRWRDGIPGEKREKLLDIIFEAKEE